MANTKNQNIKEDHDLGNLYDDLKAERERPLPYSDPHELAGAPAVTIMRNKCLPLCNKLKDDCSKHIILDIYCKILPLDKDYIDGHMGQMKSDVDGMLNAKNMTGTQYLKGCYESTHAPMLEFINRTIDNIGKYYIEAEVAKAKDAAANDMPAPDPKKPDINDKEVSSQLVDITGDGEDNKGDMEYSTFIDKLKQKTINKIVSDVSKIINDKKEEKEMTFDPNPGQSIQDQTLENESTTSIALNYINKRFITENVEVNDEMYDNMMGMAIREVTMNMIDQCFNLPNSDIKSYNTRIKLGKGNIVNESAITENFINK